MSLVFLYISKLLFSGFLLFKGNINGLLTKCEIKMAGCWPRFFFLRVFMDRDGVKIHKLAKKERGQYPAILTEQYYIAFKENFLAGHASSPERAR